METDSVRSWVPFRVSIEAGAVALGLFFAAAGAAAWAYTEHQLKGITQVDSDAPAPHGGLPATPANPDLPTASTAADLRGTLHTVETDTLICLVVAAAGGAALAGEEIAERFRRRKVQ
jgi:hypothetical protein